MNHPTLIVPLDSNVISADDILPVIFIGVCRDISSASLMAASLSEMSNIGVIVFYLYMNHSTLIVPLDSVISADDIFPANFIAVCCDISSVSLMAASLSEMSNIGEIVFYLYMNHPTLIVPLDSKVISTDDIFPANFIAVCRDISSASLMAASQI